MTLFTLRTTNVFPFFNESFPSNLYLIYGSYCEKHNDCKLQKVSDCAVLHSYIYKKEVMFLGARNTSSLRH